VVESVAHPREERVHAEEGALLAKKVELRITVEKSGRDELVKDTHGEGR
jgi:hypothetical protein